VTTERRTILISGGGIAGLSAALALVKTGHRVEVFESAEKFEPIGAGIQLSPNALRVLFDFGVERQLKMLATVPASIQMIDAQSGRQLAEIPLGRETITRYGVPYLVIHRADLHRVLLNACNDDPEIDVHMSSQVVDVVTHANGVTVLARQPSGVTEFVGSALVVADGVHSRIRSEILNLKPAVNSGFSAWRTMLPVEAAPCAACRDHTRVWLGRGAHAVTYPVRSNRYLNVVAITQSGKPGSQFTSVDALRSQFKDWHEDFTGLFDVQTHWSAWPVYETRDVENMAFGPVVLAGDAAHAMLPFAAQGAAMAIEDAAVLAQQVAAHESVEEAFLAYQKLRVPRIRKTVRLAHANRFIYHMRGPFAYARNAALKKIPGDRLLARQDWLYNWQV